MYIISDLYPLLIHRTMILYEKSSYIADVLTSITQIKFLYVHNQIAFLVLKLLFVRNIYFTMSYFFNIIILYVFLENNNRFSIFRI